MDDTRERLLDAALPLFVARGPYGVTLADIGRAAGVADPGAIFPDAIALANALHRHWKGELANAIVGDFPIDAAPREQFRVFWYRAAAFAMQFPAATAWLRRSTHQPWLDDATRALSDQTYGILVAYLVRWRAERQVRDESPQLMAAIVLGAFDGMFEAWRREHLVLTDTVVASAERAVWDALKR
jgi:AcrR family transcriptional regulator